MTDTPQTPAGWYPEGGVERWWDGNAWTSHTRPLPGAVPAPATPPPYGAAQPGMVQPGVVQPTGQKSNLARNLLIAFAVLFLLCFGGCFAVVAFVGNEAENIVNDDTEGGPNNPKEIEPGEGFEVAGFEYADGWTLGADASGIMSVQNLQVHNDRGKTDQAIVVISVLGDDVVLAKTTCTSESRIAEGRTVTLSCASADTMPTQYDEVTIQDAF
jgi:Protein of unknown function (DUF2510)